MNCEIFTKNIEILKKKPGYFLNSMLNSCGESGKVPEIAAARDGNLTMSLPGEGGRVYIHSRYRPLEDAEKWAQGLGIGEKSVILLFGFGLGYHIRALLNLMAENDKLLVVEPEACVFKRVLESADLRDIIGDSRVYILVNPDEVKLKNMLLSLMNWRSLGKIFAEGYRPYKNIYPKEYKLFLKTVRDTSVEMAVDKNTVVAFSESWQTNLLKNIPYFFESALAKDLFGIFKGRPAIVVSAGPSLNKNVHLLKKAKNRAVIISVDTALKVLLREGIKPDLVISIDGSELNYEKYRGVSYDDIPLLYTPKVYHKILSNHKGKKVLFYCGDYYAAYILNKLGIDAGCLNSAGSVANNAFDLAVKMGANPVVFVGQDLAYTGNKTHADGTMYDGKNEAKKEADTLLVDDIYGSKVPTSITFNKFRGWFERQIGDDQTGRVYINATEGGANIKGTKVMALARVIDNYCTEKINVEEKISSVIDKKVFNAGHVGVVLDELKEAEKELNYILKLCGEGSELSRRLSDVFKRGIGNRSVVRSCIKKLEEKDELIKERREKIALANYMLTPLVYTVETLVDSGGENETENQKSLRIAETSRLLYEGITNAVEKAMPLLSECIKRLEDI